MLPEKNDSESTEDAHENSSLELLTGKVLAFQVSPGSKLESKRHDFEAFKLHLPPQQYPSVICLAPTATVGVLDSRRHSIPKIGMIGLEISHIVCAVIDRCM